MFAPIAAVDRDMIISIEYAPDNSWCNMWDNEVVAWLIDTEGGGEPLPQVIGTLPPEKTGTDPILSPQWARLRGTAIIVPNLWRGEVADFFDWLSTNNGASRQLKGNFLDATPLNAFADWANDNPTMVWPGP